MWQLAMTPRLKQDTPPQDSGKLYTYRTQEHRTQDTGTCRNLKRQTDEEHGLDSECTQSCTVPPRYSSQPPPPAGLGTPPPLWIGSTQPDPRLPFLSRPGSLQEGARLTVQLLLDLQCDSLPCHLQKVDGLTQGPALEAHAVDGQYAVPNMDGTSPEGWTESTNETQVLRASEGVGLAFKYPTEAPRHRPG